MIQLKIDHIDIQVEEGTTVLEAARQHGIEIPSMCYLKGYGNHPSCMVCIVKDKSNGALVPSCALAASEGMDIETNTDEVLKARKQALEMLISDHVGDCEAPCTLACPAGMNIPLMNRLIANGQFTEALKVVKVDIALPHILGYICPAPCENTCHRKQVDEPVAICLLKRFAAAEGIDEQAIAEANKTKPTEKKVAIIGSGPAGLSAAYYLQLYGHACTIFEKSDKPGGTLRTVIPEDKLPREVIDQEVEIINSIGVQIQYNTEVTENFFTEHIQNQFDTTIIATGDIKTDNELQKLFRQTESGFEFDKHNMSTSQTGIFVCGSATKPQKMAVRSTAQGKEAAISAHHFLNNSDWKKASRKFNSRISKIHDTELTEYLKEASDIKRLEPKIDPKKGFKSEEAIREAMRCMHCDCRKKDNCKLRDYADAYSIDSKHYKMDDRKLMTKQVQHDLVLYEPEKCIKCGLCVEISERENEKFGLAFEGRGFNATISTPLGTSLYDSLLHTAAQCAEACPTGAISFKINNLNNQDKF